MFADSKTKCKFATFNEFVMKDKMDREEQNKINYYIACIGAFAEKFSISNAFAYNYLIKYQGLAFIRKFYNVEHTFSIDDTVEDMRMICQRNGGGL